MTANTRCPTCDSDERAYRNALVSVDTERVKWLTPVEIACDDPWHGDATDD